MRPRGDDDVGFWGGGQRVPQRLHPRFLPRPQGSPELVPEHAAQLALGAHRQGQEGGDGSCAPPPQQEKGYGTTAVSLAHPLPRVSPLLPQILMPALMVTAGKDVVLHPSMSKGMEEWVGARPPRPPLL